MDRETLKLSNIVLACIMEWSQEDKALPENIEEAKNYFLIQDIINSVDEGDGGYEATAIIKRLSDNKFFQLDYQEWDFDWEKGDFENFEPELEEVFPEVVETIIYK